MAYQWIHIEAVSKKGRDLYSTINDKKAKVGNISVDSVLGEAGRLEGYTSHVENPLSPVILYGDKERGVEDVRQKIEDWLAGTKDARGHKLREDIICLLSGTASLPPSNDEEDDKNYRNAFESKLINELVEEYGEDLILVIRHDDETFKGINAGKIHYNYHYFGVKKPGNKFDLHPGFLARSKFNISRKDRKKMTQEEIKTIYKDGCKAYKKAMIEFQDKFHYKLGRHFNLDRMGPRRLRRSRYEQVEFENYVEKELEYSEKTMDEALKLKEEVDKKLIEAENIKIVAEEEAERIVNEEKANADKLLSTAKLEADKVRQEAKNIKDDAWIGASNITKAAEKQAEKITQEADRIANEKKVNAEKNADEIIKKSKGFINELLTKISKLPGGDKVVKWAKDFMKSVEKPRKHLSTKAKGAKERSTGR